MDFAWLVTITGMTIVMLVLIGLVVIVSLLKVFFYRQPKDKDVGPKPEKTVKVNAPAARPTEASVGAREDMEEIVAVISAAVACLSSESGRSYTVRSVRQAGRPIWATKGLIDNVQPF